MKERGIKGVRLINRLLVKLLVFCYSNGYNTPYLRRGI